MREPFSVTKIQEIALKCAWLEARGWFNLGKRSWDGPREVTKLAEEVLEAEKQSLVLQTQSKTNCPAKETMLQTYTPGWYFGHRLFLWGVGLSGCPQMRQLCCKVKSTHIIFRPLLFLVRQPLKVCSVGRAGGASTQPSDELCWRSSSLTEEDAGGAVRWTAA